jgi:Asp-tRNA(Asn)/Glu-tRNA(Gln) amidotransferase A subunit family amidase
MFAFFLPKLERFLMIKLAQFRGDRALVLRLRGCKGVSSVRDWFDWTTASKLYIQKFETSWRDQGIDVVVCPPVLHPAMKLGFSRYNTVYAGFPGLYNLLDYVAGVVPVTKITAEDVAALDKYPIINSFTTAVCTDQKDSEGLPVGVQCVAPMWREEVCLRTMKEIEKGTQ